MKPELFNEQASTIWQKIAGNKAAGGIKTELDVYKKVLGFLQPGDYFYFIFNIKNFAFDLLSPQVESVLGYAPSTVTVPMFMERIHPEDRPWILEFDTLTTHFLSKLPVEKLMKYKVRYDFRVKNRSGNYIRLQHQGMVVEHDDDGGIIRTLGVHTDITHLKREGKPVMAYIGLEGEPSYLDISVKSNRNGDREALTAREKEILKLLIEGKLSKQVSDILNISKQTVDTHRKNMLRRNKLNNTGELVARALTQGWL